VPRVFTPSYLLPVCHPCLSCHILPTLQVRQLKQILDERRIPYVDLHEKPELVDRILERCTNVSYYA
jgi:hypothetical protein